MKNQRAFHPSGDQLESREVLSAVGVRASMAHATAQAALHVNTPFAHTLTLGAGFSGTVSRSVSTTARPMTSMFSAASLASLANRFSTTTSNNTGVTGTPNFISGLTFPGAVPNQISGLTFTGAVPNLISGLSFTGAVPNVLSGLSFTGAVPNMISGLNFR
jgi:hypothetical protein